MDKLEEINVLCQRYVEAKSRVDKLSKDCEEASLELQEIVVQLKELFKGN